jgi:hypothetical protein
VLPGLPCNRCRKGVADALSLKTCLQAATRELLASIPPTDAAPAGLDRAFAGRLRSLSRLGLAERVKKRWRRTPLGDLVAQEIERLATGAPIPWKTLRTELARRVRWSNAELGSRVAQVLQRREQQLERNESARVRINFVIAELMALERKAREIRLKQGRLLAEGRDLGATVGKMALDAGLSARLSEQLFVLNREVDSKNVATWLQKSITQDRQSLRDAVGRSRGHSKPDDQIVARSVKQTRSAWALEDQLIDVERERRGNRVSRMSLRQHLITEAAGARMSKTEKPVADRSVLLANLETAYGGKFIRIPSNEAAAVLVEAMKSRPDLFSEDEPSVES